MSNRVFLITYYFNIKKDMNTIYDFLIDVITDVTANLLSS
ncbi:hypothetical protein LGAA44_260039 [Leuconostoc gasicomitatum]|nr:hypothetical protein LGAA44_260039 [Leuconostoc gasicomitatum]